MRQTTTRRPYRVGKKQTEQEHHKIEESTYCHKYTIIAVGIIVAAFVEGLVIGHLISKK